MSKIVDAMPPSNRSSNAVAYPWADWFDGRVWELTSGEDFHVPVPSMVSLAKQTAARKGVSVTARQRGKTVWIQAQR